MSNNQGADKMEAWWETWFEGRQRRRESMPIWLDNPEASAKLFSGYYEREQSDTEGVIGLARKESDFVKAVFDLSLYNDYMNRAYLMSIIEGLNTRITKQSEIILELVKAVKSENEAKLSELATKLSEAPALTKEQIEALATFKRAIDELAASDKRGQSPYV